ncbi:MAG: BTAD domain-containing putative transcriptional regulator [Proteobacteria bacterium]|nr:BTAD domain-containing putative transcriptional regulator [Pseudomonadota bacterium]
MDPPKTYGLKLLGGFRIWRDPRTAIRFRSKKAQALLGYLSLRPEQSCTRSEATALLWGDRSEEQARHSLRQCLLSLGQVASGPDAPLVIADRERLRLNLDAVGVDVHDFERLAADERISSLEKAVGLYEGELLSGLDLKGDEFERWLAGERVRLQELAGDTLAKLGSLQAECGDIEGAIETGQRLVALDPLREEGHRELMGLLDRAGRRSGALKQFQICADMLRREFDAEPEPETLRLYSEIRERTPEAESGDGAPPTESETPPPVSPSPGPAVGPPSREMHDRSIVIDADFMSRAVAWVRRTFLRLLRWTIAAVVILLLGTILVWYFGLRGPERLTEVATEARMAFPLPQQPSIVVLPFEDLSDDPMGQQFAIAVTEGITMALSVVSDMFVIAHNSTLAYEGKPVKIQQVAEELGVRYVLQGSVQKVEDEIRVNTQLINALTGVYEWAQNYDREITDIFEVQDEITLNVITALQVELTEGEQDQVSLAHGTDNLEAWILAGDGLHHLRRATQADNAQARQLYLHATRLDPAYPGAWDGLAWTHLLDARFGWSDSRLTSLVRAEELARRALDLGPDRPRTFALLGSIHLLKGAHEQAVDYAQKAVSLSPNGAEVRAVLALILSYAGEPERSVFLLKKAMRLSPYYPIWYVWNLGRAYRLLGRYGEAIAALENSLGVDPNSITPRIELLHAQVESGRLIQARAQGREVLRIDPNFSTSEWLAGLPYKDQSSAELEAKNLRRAGLPE